MATKTLSIEQCKAMFHAIDTRGAKRSKATDYALFAALLLCGSDARAWTWRKVVDYFLDMPYPVYAAIKDMAVSKKLTVFPFNHVSFTEAHWVNGTKIEHAIFTVGATPLTTQEVTRRMKRHARLAGIPSELMSLRTITNTHNLFLNLYGSADEFADALDLPLIPSSLMSSRNGKAFSTRTNSAARVDRDPRLHGIERRRPISRPA